MSAVRSRLHPGGGDRGPFRPLLPGPVTALGVGGLLHFAAYVLLSPPPYHWYYAPSAVALTLVAVLAGGALVARRRSAPPVPPRVASAAVAVVAAAVVAADLGFALSRPLPWDLVPISTNWATAEQYREVGAAVAERTGGEVVRSPGEIGALAYYCECDIVDPFADPGTLEPLIEQRREEAGPLLRQFLRLNFANRGSATPAVPDWELEWVPPQEAPPDAWPVGSAWRGPGAFVLLPADD